MESLSGKPENTDHYRVIWSPKGESYRARERNVSSIYRF